MKRALIFTFALLCVISAFVQTALAEKRLALVIGINDYKDVPKLEKAVGDASAIGDKLASLGFIVTKSLNPDRRSLNQALANLYKSIEPGDTVLVHYSGHGIEITGQNYLLPADIPSPENGDIELLKSESLSMQNLVDTLSEKGATVRIVIIDACRDNPFSTKGKRSLGSTRGLAAVEPPKGTFIMFSAGAGQSALDRLSDSDSSVTSVYTRVLLSRLDTKGLALRDLAASVREDVDKLSKSVGHEQRPAYYDDLPKDFSFVPGDATVAVATTPTVVVEPTPPIIPATTPAGLNEEQAYKMAESINTSDSWNAFIQQYPGGLYAPYALAARKKLLAEKAAAAKPRSTAVVQPAPLPKIKKKLSTSGCSETGRVAGLPVNDNFLAVRSGPGTGFTELMRLYNGDVISVCSRSGRWLRINGSGAAGWVSEKYISFEG